MAQGISALDPCRSGTAKRRSADMLLVKFGAIVEGLPSVKMNGVGGRMDGFPRAVPNTFGCAYPGSDPAAAELRAAGDFNEKKLGATPPICTG